MLVVVSCSQIDDPGAACGGLHEYNSADTVIVCFSETAVEIAMHYDVNAYLLREYQIARDPDQTQTGASYNLAFSQWKQESWLVRRSYLPFPFARDILLNDSSLVLFNMLTYPEQFSFGWTDTFADSTNLNDPTLGHIWVSDNRDTPGFDGHSELYLAFSDAVIYLR